MSEETEVPELPLTEDGPTEDVEIEITEEDLEELGDDFAAETGEEEQQEEPQQEEQPQEEEQQEEAVEEEETPRRKRSADRRIAELARKAAEAERRAQEVELRLMQAELQRQQSDMAMMTHYEHRLQGQAQAIKQQLIDAHSIGDSERIVELQGEYYKLQNDLNSIENWKAQQELTQPQPKQAVQPQPQPQPKPAQPTLEPRTADWIQKNSWFQPNSADFDPEMHEEATLYARRVERRYRAEGREDEIGGVDYFTEIDRHMYQEFPDAFSERASPSKKVPPMSRESNVAPVQRGAAPGQASKKTTTGRLTADQRQMARNMNASGAFPKKNGVRMSDAEAEKYYFIYMQKQKGA